MKIIFDVYPLINTQYTGIPQTTWHMARYIADNIDNIDCLFTIGYRVLDSSDVQGLLVARSGQGFAERFAKTSGRGLSLNDLKDRIYLSPHVMSIYSKSCLGLARIIHDISSVTFSDFHHPDTVRMDGRNISIDIKASDIIFTVSESSRAELISYLGVEPSRVHVTYPGVEWSATQWKHLSELLFDKPYVLILSTREPRKNINLVIDYLVFNSASILAGKVKYVFAGPVGWGTDHATRDDHPIHHLVKAGKVLFTGFVPEELKLTIMANARYLIFPSFFEGFGSPVAEALSLGTPVVCSSGGALPEVGGQTCRYFSPDSLESLSAAILDMEFALSRDSGTERRRAIVQGNFFTWKAFCEKLFGEVRNLYLERTINRRTDQPMLLDTCTSENSDGSAS